MVKKKDTEENKLIKSLSNVWEFLAYALKYRTKEILGGALFILFAIIIILLVMVSGYNQEEGFHKKATETKMELKK